MAKELRPRNVAAVSIWMGGLDTERARAYLATFLKTSGGRRNASRRSFTAASLPRFMHPKG